MSAKTLADILDGMSASEQTAWYKRRVLVALAGLATLRGRTGNQALNKNRAVEIVNDAFVSLDESDLNGVINIDQLNAVYRKQIFSAINRLHEDTRTDRGPDTVPIDEKALEYLSLLSKNMFEERVHDRDIHRRFGKLAPAYLAKSRLRSAGRRYFERLDVYSVRQYDVDAITEDLGCTREDLYKFRQRVKKIIGGDDV